MKNTVKLENTGERMIPEYHQGSLIYAEHITRYQAAQKFVEDKTVLDIASGSGYGTALLAKSAKKVFGVDVDEDSIAYAKENYGSKNIEFKVGDGESIPLPDNSVDVVITFETIEHIKDYKKFLRELNRVLRPEGVAIVSTPNDLEFAEGNHFHLHEFKHKELYDLLRHDFKNIDAYYQATWKAVALGSTDDINKIGIMNIESQNLAEVEPEQYLYFYFVCSNQAITEKIKPLLALGAHYSDRQQQAQDQERIDLNNALKDSLKKASQLEHDTTLELEARAAHIKELEAELKMITESRTYKAAVRMRDLKSRIAKSKSI